MLQKFIFSFFIAGLFASMAFGQKAHPIVTFSNPSGVATPKGYTHLVEVDLGTAKMVILSGQVAMDGSGNVVGKDDPKAQFEQIFRNMQTLVSTAGGKMEHVVKLTIFLRDVAHIQTFRDVRDQFINREHPPASTTVEVSNLFRSEFLAEVEATAIIPKVK